MRKTISVLTCVLGLFLLHSHIAMGQMTTATISGTVKDATGAVLPGVSITIRNTGTGITRTVTADGQGRYVATSLALGNYEVEAQLQGFQTALRSGIELTVGREAVVPFELAVGTVAERVEVTGEAPLVETTSSTVGGLVDTKQIEDLPINGRSYDKLARLETGVTFTKKAGAGTGTFAVGGSAERMSIGGSRVTQNLFLLDGTDISDKRGTSPGGVGGSALGMEAIREFRVLTSTYSAQYGRASGGVVEVVSKSGTNEFHGSAFAYHRNDNLDATRWENNSFFNGRKPEFKRNQFGASLGGPIIKNRTFFFGNYEGLRERLGGTTLSTVPDAGARTGRVGTSTVTVADAIKPYLALYPLPNGKINPNGTGDFGFSSNRPTRQDYFTVRGDHQLSQNHSLMGRFTFEDASVVDTTSLALLNELSTSRSEIATLEYTSILSPTLLNKFRAGLNRSLPNAQNDPFGLPEALTWVPGQPLGLSGQLIVRGGITPLGGSRRLPNGFAWNAFQWGDDLSYVRGRHSLKMGVGVQRFQYNHKGSTGTSGEYTFSNLSNFLQNRPQSFFAQSSGTRDRWLRQTLFGAYIQDDLALRSNLTLNLGVRLEFISNPHEKFGYISHLPRVTDTQLTVGNPLFETTKNNWAPRIGIAWDPTGKGTTSVRTGFGIFHDQPLPTYWYLVAQTNPPFISTANIANPPFPNAWDIAKVTTTDLKQLELRGMNYSGTGYAMQYNLMVQQQVGSDIVAMLGYMGSQARKLYVRGPANTKVWQILADGRKFFPTNAPLINPALGDVWILTNDTNSGYNALVSSFRKRFGAGLQLQASYTYSKVLSIGDTVASADLPGGRSWKLDNYDAKRDRGPADHDIRHSFVLNSSYDLPFGQSSTGVVKALISNWQLGGILSISSGSPFAANSPLRPGDGVLWGGGGNRADVIVGGKANAVQGGINGYFDVNQFEPSKPGFYGNVGRNTMYDPGMVVADLSLRKNASLTEVLKLEFRAELFNFLNKPNFATPGNDLFDGTGARVPNAGNIRTTATTARQIQFGMRLSF